MKLRDEESSVGTRVCSTKPSSRSMAPVRSAMEGGGGGSLPATVDAVKLVHDVGRSLDESVDPFGPEAEKIRDLHWERFPGGEPSAAWVGDVVVERDLLAGMAQPVHVEVRRGDAIGRIG